MGGTNSCGKPSFDRHEQSTPLPIWVHHQTTRPSQLQKTLSQSHSHRSRTHQPARTQTPVQPLRTHKSALQITSLRHISPWKCKLPYLRVPIQRVRMRLVSYIISRNMTLFTFDFAGCGLSEGEYISLGYFERGDVDTVFKYLRGLGTVSSIGIWGRSMGAVTALMYADSNHEIGCLVLDSPFSNL